MSLASGAGSGPPRASHRESEGRTLAVEPYGPGFSGTSVTTVVAVGRKVLLEGLVEHRRRDGVNPLQAAEDEERIAVQQLGRLQPAEPVAILLDRRLVRASGRLLGARGQVLVGACALQS